MNTLRKLQHYMGKRKALLPLSMCISAVSEVTGMLTYVFIWLIVKGFFDTHGNGIPTETIPYAGWAAGLAVGSVVLYYLALMCSHLAAFRVQANIRTSLMRHILTLPMGFLDKDGTGKIRKIVNESSAATETYLAHQLPDQAGAIATPAGLLVLLMVFDFRLGLLSLIPVVAAFLIMGTMTGQRMKDKMEEYQNALDEMSSEAVEYVRGIPVVKTFGQSVFSFKRFQVSIRKYEKWTIAYTKEMRIPMTVYTTVINAVFAVLIAATYFFAGKEGDNTFLLNLLFYIIITPIITVTMNKIMYSSENQLIVTDAISRIESILEKKPLPETAHAQEPENNSITFENVSFRYEDGGRDALHQINLAIKEGEHVAFVGPSGGGKTTLASLVARFFDTTEGRILIGNKDVKEIPSRQLMDMVSFVFQDSKLLKTSILENVRMGKKDATREEVMQALKEAQCEDIIAKLPDGIDTVIGSSGTYVSGGEAQRLSIARAMLSNASILLADEATAALDTTNAQNVIRSILELKDMTRIVVTHSLNRQVLSQFDHIIVMKDGEIVDIGTFDELYSKKELFYSLVNVYE